MGLRIYARRYLNEFDAGGGGGDAGGGGASDAGGLDMAAAVNEIGSSLGFDTGEDTLAGGEDTASGGEDTVAGAPAPAPAPAPGPAPAPAPAPGPAPAPPSGTPRFTKEVMPTTWKPELAPVYAALPENVREEIARRESDMFRGLETYKADATFAKDIRTVIGQDMHQELQRVGIPAQQFVGNLVNAHRYLSSTQVSMEQKQGMVQKLITDYGIQMPGATPPADDNTYVDPTVADLQATVKSLQARLDGTDNAKANEIRSQHAAALNAFATDPKNQYFDEVADDIAMLIRGSGGQMPLAEAYERAVRANPVTFAKETARLQAEAVEKARKEDADKAAAAAKAKQGRVRTSGHQGGGTAEPGSMDDTMRETFRSIQNRKT